jgi:hypothetical protein
VDVESNGKAITGSLHLSYIFSSSKKTQTKLSLQTKTKDGHRKENPRVSLFRG